MKRGEAPCRGPQPDDPAAKRSALATRPAVASDFQPLFVCRGLWRADVAATPATSELHDMAVVLAEPSSSARPEILDRIAAMTSGRAPQAAREAAGW